MSNCDDYKFSLNQNFVNADADIVLPNWNSCRSNLTLEMNALILCGLIDAGLIDVLSGLITANPNRSLSFKILLMLVDIFVEYSRVSPVSRQQLCYSMPCIVRSLCDKSSSVADKLNARLIINRLELLSELKRRPKKPRTLQLEQMISRYKTETQISSRLWPPMKTSQEPHAVDRIHELIKESRAVQPYSNFSSWDWSLIHSALQLMADPRHSYEDSVCSKFAGQILNFFDPQSGQFCKLTDDYKVYSRTGCLLMKVLGKSSQDSLMNGQLRGFLNQLSQALSPDRLHVGLLSTKNILTSSCADYFLFIGELSTKETSRTTLERMGIVQRLNDLLTSDNHEGYAKLIISNLDYSTPGFSRCLLQKVLISGKNTCRRYATEFLGVLGKLKVNGFEDWGIELLSNQLYDSNQDVVQSAVKVLEELINFEPFKLSFINKRPSILPMGDAGVLLFSYLFSNEKFCQQTDLVEIEIERWKHHFNLKYVSIVDEMVHESIGAYKRSSDGNFPRHSSAREPVETVYSPPHLYGQLVRHTYGAKFLTDYNCLSPLLDILQYGTVENEIEVQKLKSSLWALGHVSSTEYGIACLPSYAIPCMVKIAEECSVYGIRGAAYFALNLTAQSAVGAEKLATLGWYCNSTVSYDGKWSPKPSAPVRASPECLEVVSAVRDVSLPPTPFKSSSAPKKTADEEFFRKISLDPCQISVHSCESCDLCKLTNATTPTSESYLKSMDNFVQIRVRCCSETDFFNAEDDFDSKSDDFQPKTTRSKSIGDEDHHQKLTKNDFLTVEKEDFSFSDSNPIRRPSATLSRTFPSTHYHNLAFGRTFSDFADKFSAESSPPPTVEFLAVPFCRRPPKAADSSNSLRSRLGLRKTALKHRGLPTVGYATTDVDVETVADEDVDGIYRWRLLQNERASVEDASPRFPTDLASADEDAADLSSKISIVSAPSTTVVCTPVDVSLICSADSYAETRRPSMVVVADVGRKMAKDRQFLGIRRHSRDFCFRCGPDSDTNSTDEFYSYVADDYSPTSADESPTKLNRYQEKNAVKEALRLVCLISVRKKYSEQGLLRLKQETPKVFQSPCLYADVCYLMSNYNFRLTARRFLQELFLDVNFAEITDQANRVLISSGFSLLSNARKMS